jgi:hypothetical protein
VTLSVQEVSDRLEIQDLLISYTHAIDRRDWDALDAVFVPDAFIDYTAAGGGAGDLATTKEFLAAAMPMFKSFQHLTGSTKLAIDGDTATGVSICHNPMVMEVDGEARTFFVGLWYHDEYVRTDAGWRISRRVEEMCYFHNAPEGMVPPGL